MSANADPRRWQALALLCAAQFIVILDTSIIGVALPAIQKALGFTQEGLSWIFNAYVILFGGLLLLGGRLSDLFGQRRMFSSGFAVLTLASLLAGAAWSDASLVVARGLQGVGAALIAPSALSLVMRLFGSDPAELGKAFGYWGAAAAAGGSAGVFLGGVITEWLTWRWTFFINVPMGLLVLAFAPMVLPSGGTQRGRVDWLGAGTVTSALVAAVYALVTAEQAGWTSLQTLGTLGLSGLLTIAFLIIQAVRRDPLMPLSIFRAPNLAAGNLVTGLLAGAWIPLWFYLNLYLQQVLGYSALQGGLALLPMTVTIMILMVNVTGRLLARFGFKPNLIAGLLVLVGSLALFASAPVGGTFMAHVLPASLLGALGMSLAYIPATVAAMSGARPEETGLASGLVNTSYQIGSAIGLAGVVAIASSQTATQLAAGVNQVAALNQGFHGAFIGAGVVAAVAAGVSLVSLRQPKTAAADVQPPLAA